MILTQKEVEILKELKAAGGAGRTVSALNAHDGLKRLIKVGYVEDHGDKFRFGQLSNHQAR